MTNQTRRGFLTQLSVLTASAAIGKPHLNVVRTSNYCNLLWPEGSLTVYHTNDLNGQISPVHRGLGGLAQFKSRLQTQEKNGLLLDAGGFMGDSRDVEWNTALISLMNAMGYRAAGLSGRELAMGRDNLVALAQAMQFKLVNCNHEFSGSLGGIIHPYTIIKHNGLKIGVTGVCKKLKGLKYTDPVQSANRAAALLKNQEGCHLVICLSQLGGNKQGEQLNDHNLAAQSKNIDVIIGSERSNTRGSTLLLTNSANSEVFLATAGRRCVTAGRLIFNFNKAGEKRFVNSEQWVSGAPAGQHASEAIPNLEKIKDKLILV